MSKQLEQVEERIEQNKPTRTRKPTKVMILERDLGSMAVSFVRADDPEMERVCKGKDEALRWIRDHGKNQWSYLPIRTDDDWRTVTVEQTEVRSLK